MRAVLAVVIIAVILFGELLSSIVAIPGRVIYRVFRPWRAANKWWADINGLFWVRYPLCDTWFGGHEITNGPMLETEGPLPIKVPVIIDGVETFSTPGQMYKGKCVCWKCKAKAEARNRARRAKPN
jgi:hypothetical protein